MRVAYYTVSKLDLNMKHGGLSLYGKVVSGNHCGIAQNAVLLTYLHFLNKNNSMCP